MTTDIATCPIDHVNPFDPDLLADPYPYYARLREEAPVYVHPQLGIVFVSTDELIREAAKQPKVFSNDFASMLRGGGSAKVEPEIAEIMASAHPPIDTLLTADPPVHSRYRKLGQKAFSYKRVLGMDDYIRGISNELIDGFIDNGKCEFRTSFADLLPMYVIVDMLGADREDLDLFFDWSHAFVAQMSGVLDLDGKIDAAKKVVAFQDYFTQKIHEKRESPTEDIISDLVHADLSEEGDPRKMTDAELISYLQQFLVAGNESTANSLAAALYYLIKSPEQMAELRADHSLIPNFVEESLRMLSPSNNMWRLATQDTELGGVPIKAGQMVLLRYGSGNRDACRYADPDSFDIHRENAREHLAFGHGIHTCIGAQLARREMIVAFEQLLSRLDNIQLSPDQADVTYSPNILLRGPTELNITFDKA